MTQTGVGQGNTVVPPFFAYIYRKMYRLKEAADATTGEQHNETINDPSQGVTILTQEDDNDITCAKRPSDYNSGDEVYDIYGFKCIIPPLKTEQFEKNNEGSQ